MASEVNVQNMGNLSEEREEAGSANVTLSPAWLHLCQGSPFFFHLQPIWGPLSLTRFPQTAGLKSKWGCVCCNLAWDRCGNPGPPLHEDLSVSNACTAASPTSPSILRRLPVSSVLARTELLECWICRDAGTSEPLVRPCRCRGSMGGVHASCVEAWIHRTAGTRASDEAPACPVCRTP